MDGLPFTSVGTSSSYGTQPQTVPPYSAAHTNSYNEPSSSYVTPHQMLPQQLSSHYGSSIPLPSPRTRKRTRAGSMGDGERNSNRNIGMQQSFMPGDGSVSMPEPPDILYPVNINYGPSHPGSGHGFPTPLTLPPPQHHHHHLPPRASLFSDPHGRRPCSRSGNGGHVSVVGQPGMPAPFPRPPVARTRFTPEMDRMIVELKENIGLEWKQVMDFFPGRNYNTLQVRYCKKLKERDVDWTNELVQRLRRAIDEHNSNIWDSVSKKFGDKVTANACKRKAVELGWAITDPDDNLATPSTPNPEEQSDPNRSARSGARGRGRKTGSRKEN